MSIVTIFIDHANGVLNENQLIEPAPARYRIGQLASGSTDCDERESTSSDTK